MNMRSGISPWANSLASLTFLNAALAMLAARFSTSSDTPEVEQIHRGAGAQHHDHGGGNDGESYNLMMYAAARKTALDCYEKRGRKGYFIMYADEPIYSVTKTSDSIPPFVMAGEVKAVFGDKIEGEIPIAEIIEELRRQYHVFVIWPSDTSYIHSREQFVELFGEESVVTLQHPNMICECIASIIGLNEEKIDVDGAVRDLVALGTDKASAKEIVSSTALAVRAANLAKASGGLPTSGKGAAERLAS